MSSGIPSLAESRRPHRFGRALVVTLIATILIVATLIPVYFVLEKSGAPGCNAASGSSNFTSGSVKPNGSIAMVLSNLTPTSLQPILANDSSVAFAVVGWQFTPPGPNATLEKYASLLQNADIMALGYITRNTTETSEIADFAASGLNGIYIAESGPSSGPCSITQLSSIGHALGGFVAVETAMGSLPQHPLSDVNLMVFPFDESAWNASVVEELAPVAETSAVIIEHAPADTALFLLGSLHTVGEGYFLITNFWGGDTLAPVADQQWAYEQLYQSSYIVPINWTACHPGMQEVDQAYANGTIYFLFENQTFPGPNSISVSNLSILAVNLTYGNPEFETPLVSFPLNYSGATDVSETLSLGAGVVYAVVVEIQYDAETNSSASMLTMRTEGFNASTGATISQSNHVAIVVAPEATSDPIVMCLVHGSVVTTSSVLFEPFYYVGFWISTTDVLTGDSLGAREVVLYSPDNSSTDIPGASYGLAQLGSYFAVEGTYDVAWNSSDRTVPFLFVINELANVVFQASAEPQLNLYGSDLYFLSNNQTSTSLGSYNLSSQEAGPLVSLGNLSNLTGAIVLADGLFIVNSWTGTYWAYTPDGTLAWTTEVPVIPVYFVTPFPAVPLPGNRLLVGAYFTAFGVDDSNYEQEFWVLNASTGQVLNYYTQEALIIPTGFPPGLPSNLPTSYRPVGVIGGEFQFESDAGVEFFVNASFTSAGL
jgi:hypothetical protein